MNLEKFEIYLISVLLLVAQFHVKLENVMKIKVVF